MHFYLFDPVLYILKGLPLVNGICEDYSHGSPVVGLSDGLKFFLASGVPDLETYSMFADLYGFDFEVDADRCKMRGHKVVIAILNKHVGLTHATVAYN